MPSPIVGCWFRMEKGPESTPPKYEYDEAGAVLEGTGIPFPMHVMAQSNLSVRRRDQHSR